MSEHIIDIEKERRHNTKTMVINIKSGEKYDVYIGRNMMFTKYKLSKSKWANPFQVDIYNKDGTIKKKRDGSNFDVMLKYGHYILELKQRHLLSDLMELKDKVLGCWCKPNFCHGDILVNLIETMQMWDDIRDDPVAITKKINEIRARGWLARKKSDMDPD